MQTPQGEGSQRHCVTVSVPCFPSPAGKGLVNTQTQSIDGRLVILKHQVSQGIPFPATRKFTHTNLSGKGVSLKVLTFLNTTHSIQHFSIHPHQLPLAFTHSGHNQNKTHYVSSPTLLRLLCFSPAASLRDTICPHSLPASALGLTRLPQSQVDPLPHTMGTLTHSLPLSYN